MDDLIFNAHNSLVEQSKNSKMRATPLNGDGFGIGWYPEHDDIEPATFVSIEPAWSNRNLIQLATKVQTQHFFAHVRDASKDMPVSQANCHPFQYGRFLWMHNGRLDQFDRIRRVIINKLSDKAFNFIKGNTDSEHAFAMFLDELNFDENASLSTLKQALYATIKKIMTIRHDVGADTNAFMNFAVTNKTFSLFTRFNSHESYQPASLFYKTNSEEQDLAKRLVVVSSEPLSIDKMEWLKVERNHMVILNEQKQVFIEKIPLGFQGN